MTHCIYDTYAYARIYIYTYAPQMYTQTHTYVYSHEFDMWYVNKHGKWVYIGQRHEMLEE